MATKQTAIQEPVNCDVFISHSSADHNLALQLCDYLEFQGLQCWLAQRGKNMVAGGPYSVTISEAINQCGLLLVLVTKNSVASPGVLAEVQLASSKNKHTLPVFCAHIPPGRNLEFFIGHLHWFKLYPQPHSQHFPELYQQCLVILNRKREAARKYPWQREIMLWLKINRAVILWLLLFLATSCALAYFITIQKHFDLKVITRNDTVNDSLPLNNGRLILYAGTKIKKRTLKPGENITFYDMPVKYKTEPLKLRYEAPGFETLDTTVATPGEAIMLSLKRNDDYGIFRIWIAAPSGQGLSGVLVQVGSVTKYTDSNGSVTIHIPLSRQRKTQRFMAYWVGRMVIDTLVRPSAGPDDILRFDL